MSSVQNTTIRQTGPLRGLRVIEFAGIGPGPFAAMMLADMGAEVIRIERPPDNAADNAAAEPPKDFTLRGRRSIAINLKAPGAAETTLKLIASADALIEGFRPGVMERLGLGPDVCLQHNPKLVYGRMTGWGQHGPLAHSAGHDLNYIALTGALWGSGAADRAPAFAMNLLGDFGGGGMYLAFGLVSGILQAQRSGHGDVVDAAICDGTNSLMTFIQAHRAMGQWQDERAANLLDGGAPWYSVYECADGKWISVAALEPAFWQCLLDILGISSNDMGERNERSQWPAMRSTLQEIFISQPQAHWDTLFSGTDACVAPVLSPAEARYHPHMAARDSFAAEGADQPMPAPRFAHSKTPLPAAPVPAGTHTRDILTEAGLDASAIDELIDTGAVTSAPPDKVQK